MTRPDMLFDEDDYEDLVNRLIEALATRTHQSATVIHALAYVTAHGIALCAADKTEKGRDELLAVFVDATREFMSRNAL